MNLKKGNIYQYILEGINNLDWDSQDWGTIVKLAAIM